MKLLYILLLSSFSSFGFAQDTLNLPGVWYSFKPVEFNTTDSIQLLTGNAFDYHKKAPCWKWKFSEEGTLQIRTLDLPNELSESQKRSEEITGIEIPRSRDIIGYDELNWEVNGNQIKLTRRDIEFYYIMDPTKPLILNLYKQ